MATYHWLEAVKLLGEIVKSPLMPSRSREAAARVRDEIVAARSVWPRHKKFLYRHRLRTCHCGAPGIYRVGLRDGLCSKHRYVVTEGRRWQLAQFRKKDVEISQYHESRDRREQKHGRRQWTYERVMPTAIGPT